MASQPTVIARAARVRGRVTGDGDVHVHGFVEGEVAVTGDVTIDVQGLVSANVQARRMVVRGAVKGNLSAEDSIALEDGARVVGDLRAPRIAVAPGALVRGHVQTNLTNGASTGATARAATGRGGPAAARTAASTATPRVASPPAPQARPAPASAPLPSHGKPEAAPATPAEAPQAARVNSQPSPRRPPPPVVPALKKVRGQVVKRKER